MSRLRRMVLSNRFFFVSCRLARGREMLWGPEFGCLARVIQSRRQQHGFLLTAWVFLPDHWHAIFYPRFPLTISRVMEAIKVGSTLRINRSRKEQGTLWQPRFFDRALRTVKEYGETVEYIHQNPLKAGLAKYPTEWQWSSYSEYAGTDAAEQERRCGLTIDRARLPADERAREFEEPQSLERHETLRYPGYPGYTRGAPMYAPASGSGKARKMRIDGPAAQAYTPK